ncbi:MAG: DNA translocase FtsK 4TM domain-containing protein [Alphaproteobacteria bacterium]|nr:DNA translocase FtsK 4TM domain-containing protein [Alphaproteobacteria bacterium]
MRLNRTATPGGYTPHVPKKTTTLPWLPKIMRHALIRQARVLLGLLLFVASILCLLMLVSYTPTDPSWNSFSTEPVTPHNFLGSFGSYGADALMQIFGFASFLCCVILAAWGWRCISDQGLDHLRGRLAMGFFALLAAGATLQALGILGARAGGSFGYILTAKLLHWLPQEAAHAVLATIAGLLALGSLYMACALTLGEWSSVWRFIAGQVRKIWAVTLGGLLRLWPRRIDSADEAEPQPEVEQIPEAANDENDDNDDHDDNDDSDVVLRAAKVRGKSPRKPAAVKRPPPSRQARLALDGSEGGFELPPLDLLARAEASKQGRDISQDALQKNATLLENVLADFGIQGQITHVSPGPVVTLYELEPAPGIRAARVIALADDIARSMSVRSVRVAVVPGRNVIGIEMPNQKRETVLMRELLESDAYVNAQQALPLILGKDIAGIPVIADLARMPHLLVAGTTGSGKSVSINTMILSLLYRLPPERCRFIMIDPKMLELSVYEGIPHLLAPVVTEPKKAIVALKWTVREMEERYRAMSKLGVRNIDGYNLRLKQARERNEELTRQVQTGFDPETGKPVFEEQPLDLTDLPYIVVIVDEMADLMLVAGKDIEIAVQRLAQMARAAGIHIVMATQRPSVDVITGTIKANFPTRISFQVTSKIDSRTILGEMGAEQLLGQGDMLYMAGGGRITRVHAPFVRDSEVEGVVSHLRAQGTPDYLEEVTEETESVGEDGDGMGGDGEGNETSNALYDMAVDIVQREGKASTSFLQRHLKLGYNRAATLIERMEREGVVSAANHVGKREVFNRRA